MSIEDAYNHWSAIYDSNENKTRDLEAKAIRKMLSRFTFQNILEIGCGTGKNTEWLNTKCKSLVAVDFSEKMLVKAKEKASLQNVNFIQADITSNWKFTSQQFDLVTASLVLEHVEDLSHIFKQAFQKLENTGFFYIGELHPFKQYQGSKARFETNKGVQVLECYTHQISEFILTALQNNFTLYHIEEFFDEADENSVPRILSMLFKK